jgi:hypothetical protein
VRKRSFRPMLKLALQHSKNTARGFHSLPRRSLCGVRKRSFRPMLKLALQHSKNTARGFHSLPRRSLCGVRKRSFRPMLKLALQHSKNTRARLPFPTPSELMWSAEAKLPPDAEACASALKNTARGFHSLPRRSLCGVRKQSFRPMLKLALQHSKNTRARLHLSHAVGEGLGVRAKNAPLFRTQ